MSEEKSMLDILIDSIASGSPAEMAKAMEQSERWIEENFPEYAQPKSAPGP